MVIIDLFNHVAIALEQCEALLAARERFCADDASVVVGNNARLLRLVRIAKDVAAGRHATCGELEPWLGKHWVIVRQRHPGRPSFAQCGAEQRQILTREYQAAQRAALEARHPPWREE